MGCSQPSPLRPLLWHDLLRKGQLALASMWPVIESLLSLVLQELQCIYSHINRDGMCCCRFRAHRRQPYS